jgi:hypothetical protein
METALIVASLVLIIVIICYFLVVQENKDVRKMFEEERQEKFKYLEERNKAFERTQELREDYRAIIRRLENEKSWYANALGSAMSKED